MPKVGGIILNKNIWKNYIYKYVSENDLLDFYTKFLETFEKEWDNLVSDYNFKELCQLNNGNRLRPMLVYWGYLLNKNNTTLFDISEEELKLIITPCLMVETIHKMSLLIDDWIDDDVAQHGVTSFHVVYGADTAVLLAINILLKGLLNLNNICEENYNKTLSLALRTSYDMTTGALKEVSSADKSFDIATVKEIIALETSSIVRNSLAIGYTVGKGIDEEVSDLLDDIGYCCGYIFQALNDLEPFNNSDLLKKHKGALTTDIQKNRKNIIIAYIYAWAKKKDIEKLTQITEPEALTNYILSLIDKYKIKEHLMTEISHIQLRIRKRIESIETITGCSEWCKHFNNFIDITLVASKERASCSQYMTPDIDMKALRDEIDTRKWKAEMEAAGNGGSSKSDMNPISFG